MNQGSTKMAIKVLQYSNSIDSYFTTFYVRCVQVVWHTLHLDLRTTFKHQVVYDDILLKKVVGRKQPALISFKQHVFGCSLV